MRSRVLGKTMPSLVPLVRNLKHLLPSRSSSNLESGLIQQRRVIDYCLTLFWTNQIQYHQTLRRASVTASRPESSM